MQLTVTANGKDVPEMGSYCQEKIDLTRLRLQLLTLPSQLPLLVHPIIVKVTHVRTIADTLNQSGIVKDVLGEVDNLLQAYFTLPVTTAER